MKTYGRRALLRGFRDVLVSLPVLEAFTNLRGLPTAAAREPTTQALADGAPVAKRFIALMAPDGVIPALWFPKGEETDFTLNVQTNVYEPIKARLILTQGIDNRVAIDSAAMGFGNGHAEGVASLLTGWAPREKVKASNDWYARGGPSIDQMLSTHFKGQGYVGRLPGLHFGDESPGSYSAISLFADGKREDYSNFAVLFDSAASETARAAEIARLRRKSVLDGVSADFSKLAARVSGEDKARIEAHLEAVRSIERRYATPTAACTRPAASNPMNADQRRDLYHDTMVAAMACDAVRVSTACFFHSGGGGPTLPFIDVLEDIHELSHQIVGAPQGATSQTLFTKYVQWFNGKTVRLAQKLQATATPGGGTLLDETVIFQGSEISFDHSCPNMPFVLIAGDKTPLRTGRFVKFPAKTTHTHLLTTLVNAFGHPATAVGDPAYAPGNLNGALLSS